LLKYFSYYNNKTALILNVISILFQDPPN